MPVDAVKEEIARYNTFVANKLDEDFKKPIPDDAQTIDEPPFYGVRLWPKVHHCMGGVKTDLECRVVDMDLQVIPGLAPPRLPEGRQANPRPSSGSNRRTKTSGTAATLATPRRPPSSRT